MYSKPQSVQLYFHQSVLLKPMESSECTTFQSFVFLRHPHFECEKGDISVQLYFAYTSSSIGDR